MADRLLRSVSRTASSLVGGLAFLPAFAEAAIGLDLLVPDAAGRRRTGTRAGLLLAIAIAPESARLRGNGVAHNALSSRSAQSALQRRLLGLVRYRSTAECRARLGVVSACGERDGG